MTRAEGDAVRLNHVESRHLTWTPGVTFGWGAFFGSVQTDGVNTASTITGGVDA